MSPQHSPFALRHIKMLASFVIIGFIFASSVLQVSRANLQKQTPRAIISDDFTRARPKSGKRVKSTGDSRKPPRKYWPASSLSTKLFGHSNLDTLQLGLTLWKLEPIAQPTRHSNVMHLEWVAKRVEADTQFREGDLVRLSIESPRTGYLYVINRDWFKDGSPGETNLIFPSRGEDNRLEAGKLISIPAEHQSPFRASPKSNQAGELLTIIVTSAPLELPLSKESLPIANTQLVEWEERWSGATQRFELEGGAGEVRTREEREAASRTRQLTRNDPAPQTIYLLSPKNNDGLLFNLMLSYVK